MPLVRRNGKFLSVGGKLSTTEDCCCACGNCSLPECDCPHAIACEVKFDSTDTSDRDFLELLDSDDNGFGVFYEPGFPFISIYNLPANEQLDAAVDPATFFDTWHSVCVQFCRSDDTHVDVTLTVDGTTSTMTMEIPSIGFAPSIFYAGARSGVGDSHRTLRCAASLGNPAVSEADFIFPTSSFDSLSAGATILDDQLRIDAVGSDAYGSKNVIGRHLACTCPTSQRDITEVSAMDVTLTINAVFADATCGTGTRSDNFSWHFDRIDRFTPFATTSQFKLYFETVFDDCLGLTFDTNGVPGKTKDFGKSGDICMDGDFRFPLFRLTWDDACCVANLNLTGENVIGLGGARFKGGGGPDCLSAPCIEFSSSTGFTDLADGIAVDYGDFSALLGSYTISHTATAVSTVTITTTVDIVIS